MPIRVKSRGNETAEQMLRRFKKLCEREGITKDVKARQYYEKPSEVKRRAKIRGPLRSFSMRDSSAGDRGGFGSFGGTGGPRERSGGSSGPSRGGRPSTGRTGGGRPAGGRPSGPRRGGSGGGRKPSR